MAVSCCPIDLHFVSLMVPVIAIIHLTVRGKKGQGRGNHARHLLLSLALPRVQQTSHPTVSCQHTDLSPCALCVCLHLRVLMLI